MDKLNSWAQEIEGFIEREEEINTNCYIDFVENLDLVLPVIDLINAVDDGGEREVSANYSARVFVLEVCVSQLQSAVENGNKNAAKVLAKLMFHLADTINLGDHSLSFWLPILNAFYDAHVTLSDELQNSYYLLANSEGEEVSLDDRSHLEAMRDFISDYSDLSIYDIAENFFAQSSAMPPDFFVDLVLDLYSIEEGQEIALLALMHPKEEVREVVLATIESIIASITLSSESLSRLQTIRNLYPKHNHPQIDNWIRIQRKKGVVFSIQESQASIVKLQASEVDGGGAQGIFMHIRKNRKNRLCGLLLKKSLGIKDVWMTPNMTRNEIVAFNQEAYDDTLTLRTIDIDYLQLITNHFLAITIEKGNIPDLHFLQIQEELGMHFAPERIDIEDMMQRLSITISPFTQEVVEDSLKRSKAWIRNRKLADSWFMESPQIDKLVNSCSNFVDGVKVCDLDNAKSLVLSESMEEAREDWMFHFLWTALWARVKVRQNERFWEDCFIIAHCIYTNRDLSSIPIICEMSNKSVLNSMQTMQERGTHLSI